LLFFGCFFFFFKLSSSCNKLYSLAAALWEFFAPHPNPSPLLVTKLHSVPKKQEESINPTNNQYRSTVVRNVGTQLAPFRAVDAQLPAQDWSGSAAWQRWQCQLIKSQPTAGTEIHTI